MPNKNVGPAPFGYTREGNRLALHADEAHVRARMFELFAQHERKKTVAEILNAEKYRTRAGVLFTAQSVARLLTDKRVIGVSGEVDALISLELWERCTAILRSQKKSGGATRTVAHLFSGLVFCSCGQKMYVQSNTRKYICPDCRRKIPRDDLEAVFHSQLQTYPVPEILKSDEKNSHEQWASLSFANKRRVIETITRRIEVSDKKVTCFLIPL